MFDPPDNASDPRMLGVGFSKMVWKIQPNDDFAVINAFDRQRMGRLPKEWTLNQKINYSNDKIIREFNFTQHVKTVFGDLIPAVSRFKRGEMLDDGKFRYKKELCEPVVNSDEIFYEMVRIAEEVIEKGWVYLDMKPANLGRRGGKLCIIDTDPESFYPFPPEHKPYYLMASYMIILLGSKNYPPFISETTLVQFIVEKQLTYTEFRKTYYTDPPIDTITQYGNELSSKQYGNGPSSKRIHLSAVMHPRAFFDAYDGKEGAMYSLYRLTHLSTHPPFLAAMAEVQAASRAAQLEPKNPVLKASVKVAQAFATTIPKQVEMERAIATADMALDAALSNSTNANAEKEAERADKYARSCMEDHASAIQLISVARAEYEAEKRRLNAFEEQRRWNALEEQGRLNAVEKQSRWNAAEEKRRLNAAEEQRRLNAIQETSYPYLKNENNYTLKVGKGKSKGKSKSKGTGKSKGKSKSKGTGKGKKSRVDRSRAKTSRFNAVQKNKSPF